MQACALILLVMTCYLGVWKAGFIWDDDMHITANPVVVGPLGLKEIWTTPAARICPLTLSSFWLIHETFGLNPVVFHGVTLGFFAASVILLWRVLAQLNIRWAWLGAALWAVHPVQVETVAWATELKNTQSGFFFLLSVLLFLKWQHEHSAGKSAPWLYGGMWLAAAAAMASKSSTVVLPAVLLLCWWWQTGKLRSRMFAWLLPVAILSVVSAALSVWTQGLEGAQDVQWDRGLMERIMIAGRVVWFYLGKLLWPHPVTFVYPRWQMSTSVILDWLPLLALVVAFIITWRWRTVWLALVSFVVMLAPVLGLVEHYFLRYSYVGDHFQYLASMAPLALLAAGLSLLGDRWGKMAASAVVACFAGLTMLQVPAYESSKKLFEDTVAKNPDAWMAYSNLAALALDAGDDATAERCATRCLSLLKEHPGALSTIGNISLRLGRVDEAMDFFSRAVAEYERQKVTGTIYHEALSSLSAACLKAGKVTDAVNWGCRVAEAAPHFAPGYNNLGMALAAAGERSEALEAYEKAIALDPHYAQAAENVGRLLLEDGSVEEALRWFQRAAEMKPGDRHFKRSLALAMCKAGRTSEGLKALDVMITESPKDRETWLAKAEVLVMSGDHLQARRCYESMVKAGLESPEVLNNLASLCMDQADWKMAVQHASRALQLAPSSTDAHYNLGTGLLMTGSVPDAVTHLRAAARQQPDSYRVQMNLGAALLQNLEIDPAVQALTKACELNPESAGAAGALGRAWLAKGDTLAALPWLRKAVKLNPRSVEDWVALAWVLSTHLNDEIRNGAEGLAAARAAEQIAEEETVPVLRVMAAACAENGSFAEAELYAEKALAALKSEGDPHGLAISIETERQRYAAREPVRSK